MPLAPPVARAPGRRPDHVLSQPGRTVSHIARLVAAAAVAFVALACSSGTSDDALQLDASTPTATVDGSTPPAATSPMTSSPLSTNAPSTNAPSTVPAATGAPGQPDGFTTAQAIVTSADGEVCEICVWLADDAADRARGLMDVTDLGEPAGMVFAYAEDTTGNFFMFNTPTPLSIAWFARDGAYLAEADMEPCLVEDSATCTRYNPGAPFAFALEVFQGDLAELGVGPGSTLRLVPGSEATTCPVTS